MYQQVFNTYILNNKIFTLLLAEAYGFVQCRNTATSAQNQTLNWTTPQDSLDIPLSLPRKPALPYLHPPRNPSQAHKASGTAVAASDLVSLIALICVATHKLVRNQMTWFRDQPTYHWMDVAPLDAAGAADRVLKELRREEHAGGGHVKNRE